MCNFCVWNLHPTISAGWTFLVIHVQVCTSCIECIWVSVRRYRIMSLMAYWMAIEEVILISTFLSNQCLDIGYYETCWANIEVLRSTFLKGLLLFDKQWGPFAEKWSWLAVYMMKPLIGMKQVLYWMTWSWGTTISSAPGWSVAWMVHDWTSLEQRRMMISSTPLRPFASARESSWPGEERVSLLDRQTSAINDTTLHRCLGHLKTAHCGFALSWNALVQLWRGSRSFRYELVRMESMADSCLG